MALPHAKPGEPVDVSPYGEKLASAQTTTLIKTDSLEVLRLVLPGGKEIGNHQVEREVTIQCVEGRVTLSALGAQRELTPGVLVYLPGSTQHALNAAENSSLLVTILL